MKRTVSILLALILAMSCCIFTATAEDGYRDPAEWPVDPVINPKLNPELHPKYTPALLAAIEAAAPSDTEQYLGMKYVVYFDADYLSIEDMPSWPDYAVNNEYSEYVFAMNTKLAKEAFRVSSLFSVYYIDYYIPGCIIVHDGNLDELRIAEQSDLVRSIDIFDPDKFTGKLDIYTAVAMNVYSSDDYIPVWVGNSAHMKSADEMPSWPTGRNTDLEATRAQLDKARAEYSAYRNDFNDRFVAEAFDGIDAVVYSGFGFMVLAAVKIADIEKLADRDCVRYIEFSENPTCDNEGIDIEPEPVDAPDSTYYEWKLRSQYEITDTDCLDFEVLHLSSDWALVRAFRFDLCYATALHSAAVGGRRLTSSALGWNPFTFAYGVYNARQDRYYDLTQINFDDYDGLYEVWQKLELTTPFGRIYEDSPYFDGDADGDSEVTILDATRIQRRLADLCSKYDIVETSADVDRDGSVTILDATYIQRFMADLCNIDGSPCEPEPGKAIG